MYSMDPIYLHMQFVIDAINLEVGHAFCSPLIYSVPPDAPVQKSNIFLIMPSL